MKGQKKRSQISVEGLTFRYGGSRSRAVLQQLTMNFDSSHITVITGPSGCGKSTLLFLAAGLSAAQSSSLQGQITIDGQHPAAMAPHLRCQLVSMMFQHPDLQFCMDTVERELVFCLENIGVMRSQMDERMEEALSFCGISQLKERMLISLSGGEKQKVMLACLVALRPKWLLLDEPFANIDDESAVEILKNIGQLHKTYGIGIVAVDHRIAHWTDIAHRWVEMDHQGHIAQVDLPFLLDKMRIPMDMKRNIWQGCGQTGNGLMVEEHHTITAPQRVNFTDAPLLTIKNLQLFYGESWVLKKVDASFFPGQIYAILGASGSGKSSLLGAIRGTIPIGAKKKGLRPDFWRGKREKMIEGACRLKIGLITQSPQDQFLAVDVWGEIMLSLHKRLSVCSAREQEAEEILRKIGLWSYRKISPYRLSQGQQRRLGVAAVLACACDLLLADEPTYGQDLTNAVGLMEALEQQVRRQKSTLIFTTHDRWLAERYADAIYEMRDGQLHLLAERRAQ